MSNEQPQPTPLSSSTPPPASAAGASNQPQTDPLATELMNTGTFDDAAGGEPGAAPITPASAGTEPAPPDLSELEHLLKNATFDDAGATTAALEKDLADELLSQARGAVSQARTGKPAAQTAAFDLPAFQQALSDAQASSIDLLRDVDLNVKIELGRSRMMVEDVLKLSEGSVVELDKLAGDPVDVFVNDRLVARGEVLVLNDNFCVRVNEIVAGVKDEG